MRVTGGHLQQIVGAYVKQTRKADPTPGQVPVGADQISLSREGGDILRARQVYDRLPEVREAKVADIRNGIAAGSYQLDDARISQSILVGSLRDRLLRKDEG